MLLLLMLKSILEVCGDGMVVGSKCGLWVVKPTSLRKNDILDVYHSCAMTAVRDLYDRLK